MKYTITAPSVFDDKEEFAKIRAFIEATKDWTADVDALLEKIAKDDQELLEKYHNPDIGTMI